MRYDLTEAARALRAAEDDLRDLRIRLQLRDDEIQRLRAECQTTLDELVKTAGELAVMKFRLEEAGLSTEWTPSPIRGAA